MFKGKQFQVPIHDILTRIFPWKQAASQTAPFSVSQWNKLGMIV